KYIVFTSNKLGFENFELFIVDMEGRSAPVQVTFTKGFDGLPVFSPDGKKLCWTSNRGSSEKSQLFMADWNHEAALAALGATKENPVIATDDANAPVLSYDITAEDARAHVELLAADDLEGRKTGQLGAKKAASYLAARFADFGLKPLADPKATNRSSNPFFQRFEFTEGVDVRKDGTTLQLRSGAEPRRFEVEKDFLPLSFSSNGKVEGEVVFAGYGLSVPGKLGEGYDSYAGLDVSNKIALVMRYVPEEVSPERRMQLNRYAALRYKAMIARERGAKAILIVSGPNSPTHGKLIPLSSDGTLAGSDILAASITTEVADAILASTGKTLKDLQSALDQENPHAEKAPALTNTTVSLSLALDRKKSSDHNVIAVLPGESDEYVMVGAHYDHLGFGEEGGSREHSDEKGQIHNGADDNASGVAAVLELAQHFAKVPDQPLSTVLPAIGTQNTLPRLKRGVIFALWSGEEMGLLGSSHFAEHPPVPLSNITAYVNFDMVGRLRTNKLTLQGIASSGVWPKLIERRNIVGGFDLNLMDDPYLPSDTTAFYPKGIPVLAFFTGSHDDYHRPTDDIATLNYEGIERITKFAGLLVRDLVNAENRPAYVKVERSNAPGSRDSLRAYLGTIPDYATEVKGVKISGVRGGSPAEKAGLQGGDVIVEFAGQKVANIYDYTYSLDAAKIGQPLKIKVLRKDQPVEITVTPEARK
ncbi:MAG TPA: M28 family peptidase, partial [Candidatus Kapabacteria bacterium]|nr:M28 family peptidase [Candidatus Kapabacteria bacterium]